MESLKNVGGIIVGVAVLCGLLLIAMMLVEGAASVSEFLLPYLATAISVALPIFGLLLLPLAFFRQTRIVAAWGMFASSFLFGIATFMEGLIITYTLWGVIWVVLGLAIAGVGVVPLGMIAAALEGEWQWVGELLMGTVLTYGARFFALYLFQLEEQRVA